MAFTTNHSKVQESNLMEPGEYELIILDVGERLTQGGTEYISCHCVVRNDVEQKYKNKHVWDSMWLSERALPYTERKINTIDKVLEMPEASYASYDEWGAAVQGKPIRAKITHSKAQEGYAPREQISFYMETRHPDVKHVFQTPDAPTSTVTKFTEVQDDELPF